MFCHWKMQGGQSLDDGYFTDGDADQTDNLGDLDDGSYCR